MLLKKVFSIAAVCALAFAAATTPAQTGTAPASTTKPSDQNSEAQPHVAAATVPVGGASQPQAQAVPAGAGTVVVGTPQQTPAPSQSQNAPQASLVSTGAAGVSTGGTRVHGTITDPDGYPIPGATVSLTPTKGNGRSAKTQVDGTYSLVVTPGSYTVVISMTGFASYSATGVHIPAVAASTLDAKLTIGQTTQVVNVDSNAVQVSVDPDSNASSTVLTGKDLDALSDDPDELASELQALAGPSAGPSGGQIYVDGFTGGQLPPKSSIREIRINQNPFSAEYDKLGYGRIEIFTKPGTDQFHGSLSMLGNAKQFNAGLPPDYDGTPIPGYHTYQIYGSISGPISKKASFNVGGYHRTIQDAAFTNATILALPSAPATPCIAGQANFGACVSTQFQSDIFQPQSRTEVAPRIDLALGANNTLTTRFQYERNESVNSGVGGLRLANTGIYSSSTSYELQVSDTQSYGPHVINETRGEIESDPSSTTPNSNGVYINVQGSFNEGGSPSQADSSHSDHYELQNYTSIQTKKNFIRLGGRLRADREAENTNDNTNGTFTYAGLTYGGTGVDNSYATGVPSQFTRNIVNNHDIDVHFIGLGLYAETDWKPLPNLTLSYGLRYEVQNFLSEHHDFAPRLSFAYGVGSKNRPVTVIRGGFGIFYDRFSEGSILEINTQNGQNLSSFTIPYTTLAATPGCNPNGNISNCPTGTAAGQTVMTVPGETPGQPISHVGLTSPYIVESAIGADQQVGKFGTLSVNFIHTEGGHALAVQNVDCAPSPTTGVCTNTSAYNNQFLSEGHFHENQLLLNPKVQLGRMLSLFGYYTLSYAAGNNSGAETFLSQPGNINADIGRTSFDIRSRYFFAGTVSLPHFISLSPFVIGSSGAPFNVVEGQDINGDGVFNDRPLLVPAGTPGSTTLSNCGTFLSRRSVNASQFSQIVPAYACKGPALFTTNIRITKTFGFGGQKVSSAPPDGGHGSGGPPGGHSHSGGSHSSGSHDFLGGSTSTGQKYNVSLGVQMLNLFNTQDLASPVATLNSPNFGKSIALAGSPYTSNDARFRLQLNAVFSF